MRELVLGTRGSALARAQSEQVAALLRGHGYAVRLEIVRTRGDREQDRPVVELSGIGFFTAELVEALRRERIDFAVHSFKDLPTEEVEGLAVGAVLPREDPHDVLVSRGGKKLAELAEGATVGTASLRRQAFVRAARPDLKVAPLRGNVDTRLSKVESGAVDAAVLAAAGLARLGRSDRITEVLPFLPAPAQGALAVQARAEDAFVLEGLHRLDHPATAACATAERRLLAELQGGCSVPVGALAEPAGNALVLRACVASLDGRRILRAEERATDAEALGRLVASRLLNQGAREILDAQA